MCVTDEQHAAWCYGPFTCIDCNVTFQGRGWKEHTKCITEEEKYQKGDVKKKGKPNMAKVREMEPAVVEIPMPKVEERQVKEEKEEKEEKKEKKEKKVKKVKKVTKEKKEKEKEKEHKKSKDKNNVTSKSAVDGDGVDVSMRLTTLTVGGNSNASDPNSRGTVC
jgi:cell growth-regulating nucleolar protein